MTIPLDLKAIGYGFATFMAGTLAMTIVGVVITGIGTSPTSKPGWGLFNLLGYLVPVAAGYVAGYCAPAKRILHGTVGGSIGVLLLLAPALVVPGYPLAGIPIIIVSYAALASLGAIVGNHRRKKVGA